MCVALPGEVIELKNNIAVCNFSGNIVEARCGLVEVEPGDRVLVHAGCILQKVSKQEADAMEDIFKDISAFGGM